MSDAHRLIATDYLDPTIFNAERERIFDRHWHMVGLLRDLSETNDWRLVTIAGTEVILQNVGDGDIRAFTNVCPHRFNAIRTKPKGNGPLRCSYHLWSFDAEGLPTNVPFRGNISLEECRANARLEQWKVEHCGELLFIARTPSQSLDAFLGPLQKPLLVMANGLGAEVDVLEQEIAANWKIVQHNTNEYDHVYSIHPETFAPMIHKRDALIEHEATAPNISYLIRMVIPGSEKPAMQKIQKIYSRAVIPPHEGYMHWSLFPSGVIGTTFNHLIALNMYQPLSTDRTRAITRTFLPKFRELSGGDRAILSKVVPADIDFTHRLMDEDKRICESVQRGLLNAPAGQQECLMEGDKFIDRWQRYWTGAMNRA